jgi:ABC-type dipeptide/oligopeptide/nickel transport system permease subunit
VEITPTVDHTSQRLIFLWRIRMKLFQRNLKEFMVALVAHPTALIGGIIVIIYVLGAIFAPQITSHDPSVGDLHFRLTPPAWQKGGSWEYPLGTDDQGRDLLTRIIFGGRVSLLVGGVSVGISVLVGGLLGAVSGFYRGKVDAVVSRFADLLLAFPFLIFALGVMAFIGPGIGNLIMALIFKGWVEFFRLVRGEMMSEKTQEYVEAAKVSGLNNFAIMVKEILPNIIQPVIVLATLRFGEMIIMEASLSFLGLGIPPHIPAWGSMVSSGRDLIMAAWWVSTLPGLALMILVLSTNILGEGLRDILDPRLKTIA